MKYCVDLPYPEVEVEKRNIELVKKALKVYAGEISEEVSAHTYIFQSLFFSDYKDIANTLEKIAIVEMHHIKLLGLLIKKLGLVPAFLSLNSKNEIKWFNTSFVSYEKTFQEAILNDICMEKKAIQNYEKLIALTNDQHVILLLKRIIMDEKLHIQIFVEILKNL